jgi:3-deoxy-manno-octulosonate cytidylyltransferase (CMP-KDO synthetase)
MINGQKIACVIPARLQSSRFKEKVLKNLGGKPILQWVWEKAIACKYFDEVVFAIDDMKTAQLIETFHGKWAMTDTACQSGTMRIIDYRNQSLGEFDLWLNWQADEPLIPLDMIYDLLNGVDGNSDVYTLKKKISNEEALKTNLVKVVTDLKGQALYFSRSKIPFIRDDEEMFTPYYKHIGLYLYTDKALEMIKSLQMSYLEKLEKLEQLTFLYNGLKIKVLETVFEGIGIDCEEDLYLAEESIATTC